MRSVSLPRFVISIAWCFFTLSANGLWGARAYDTSAGIYLLAFQLFSLLSLSYFWYFIFGEAKNRRKRVLLVLAGLVFIASWLFLLPGSIWLNPSFNLLDASYDFYVLYGMVLSQVYRINWFWMDWGVWLQCVTVYVFGLYLYIVAQALNTFIKTPAKKKEKRG